MTTYGNVINAVIAGTVADRPVEPGTPATLLMWSDRVPYVVTRVQMFKSGPRAGQPRCVWARRVRVTHDSSAGPAQMGHQNWEIHLDQPYGDERRFAANKHGDLIEASGCRLVVGHAENYYDWSF